MLLKKPLTESKCAYKERMEGKDGKKGGGEMSRIVRYGGEKGLTRKNFGDIFEELLNDFFESAFETSYEKLWPRVDIEEDEEGYVIKAEVPGVRKEDLSIEIENNVLTIRGEKREEREEKEKKVYRRETYYGEFKRSFALPEHVDVEKVEAEFRDGVLMLKLPKVEEQKARKIEIK